MKPELAARFARDWIEAWNARDIDRVLAHYSEDVVLSSPLVARIAGVPDGRLQGKQAVRAYWLEALALYPSLRFSHVCTLCGTSGLVIHYMGAAERRVAEVLHFNRDGLVVHAQACYEVMAASDDDAGDA